MLLRVSHCFRNENLIKNRDNSTIEQDRPRTKRFCSRKEPGPILTSDLEYVSQELKALRFSMRADEVAPALRRLSTVWSESPQVMGKLHSTGDT
jgi:hypothetical protein